LEGIVPYIIQTRDKPDYDHVRAEWRAEHLEYLKNNLQKLLAGGALVDDRWYWRSRRGHHPCYGQPGRSGSFHRKRPLQQSGIVRERQCNAMAQGLFQFRMPGVKRILHPPQEFRR